MKPLVTVVGMICASVVGIAQADATWICALDSGWTSLQCVADEDPAAPKAAIPEGRHVVNGTAFPLDDRRQYSVPLWTPATDAGMLRDLADATMCYRTPDCRVILANLPVALTMPVTRVARR